MTRKADDKPLEPAARIFDVVRADVVFLHPDGRQVRPWLTMLISSNGLFVDVTIGSPEGAQ